MSGSTRAILSAAFAPKRRTEALDRRGDPLIIEAFDAEPTAVLSGNGLAQLLDSQQALPSEPPRVFPSDCPPAASSGGPLQTAMATLNSAPRAYFDEDTSDEDATRVLPSREGPPSPILALDDPATTVSKRRQSASPEAARVCVMDAPDFRRGIYRAPALVLTTLAVGSIALILVSL